MAAAAATAGPGKPSRKEFVADQDVRWCPGCGDYSILANVQRIMPELGVPRATVSRRLARLEERLGARLLRRTTRSLALTPAGETFYRHARIVLDAVKTAEASVARTDAAISAGVSRYTSSLFGSSHMRIAYCAPNTCTEPTPGTRLTGSTRFALM